MIRARTITFPVLIALLVGMMTGCADEELTPTSMTAVTVALDSAPPAIPTGLVAGPTGSMVKIRWEPNTIDLDLDGYLVYRLAFGNSYLLTESPITENRFVDARPLHSACLYAVTAVDVNGNQSPWQTVPYDSNPDLLDMMDGGAGE